MVAKGSQDFRVTFWRRQQGGKTEVAKRPFRIGAKRLLRPGISI
jgi:hypothetical protein